MHTFRHAGDLGDCIFSLPVVRYFGGGAFLIEATSYTRVMLTPDKWNGLDLLLKEQPYIKEVRAWTKGEPCSYNLNDFRARLFRAMHMGVGKEKHLAHWMLEAHGLPHSEFDKAWLQVNEPVKAARVIFSRAGAGRKLHQVYQNQRFPWRPVWDKYHKDAVFIGTDIEHAAFCALTGPIEHYKTANLFEAARVIAGCELFVGNQSAPHAIASGMKKKIILEVWMDGPNCLDLRPGVLNVENENMTYEKTPYTLPEL